MKAVEDAWRIFLRPRRKDKTLRADDSDGISWIVKDGINNKIIEAF